MDYMGSLGVSSITDMLPDKLLIQPSGDTYTRSGKHVRVGLHVYTCPACGKQFEATTEHRYRTERRMEGDQRVRVYCSYKCFRPVEKAMEDKFKADCFGFVQCNGGEKTPLERAKHRVKKCQKKIDDLVALINNKAKFYALTDRQRHAKRVNLQEWKRKLAEAKDNLEVMEEMEREFSYEKPV